MCRRRRSWRRTMRPMKMMMAMAMDELIRFEEVERDKRWCNGVVLCYELLLRAKSLNDFKRRSRNAELLKRLINRSRALVFFRSRWVMYRKCTWCHKEYSLYVHCERWWGIEDDGLCIMTGSQVFTRSRDEEKVKEALRSIDDIAKKFAGTYIIKWKHGFSSDVTHFSSCNKC